jgi:hypothetical protein
MDGSNSDMANERREAGSRPALTNAGTAISFRDGGYQVPMRIWTTAKIKLRHQGIKQAFCLSGKSLAAPCQVQLAKSSPASKNILFFRTANHRYIDPVPSH